MARRALSALLLGLTVAGLAHEPDQSQPPAPDTITQFKLYGERNTGTRYLQQLLNGNLAIHHVRLKGKLEGLSELQKDVVYSRHWRAFLGWKHMCAPSADQLRGHEAFTRKTLFVVTAKNPYSWLVSLWKHPYHYGSPKPTSFTLFMQRPFPVLGRENFEGCGGQPQRHQHSPRHFRNPMDMWNRKMKAFYNLATVVPHCIRVKYEWLVADPEEIVQQIHRRFNVAVAVPQPEPAVNTTAPVDQAGFQNIDKSTKTKAKSFTTYQRYYMNEEWKRFAGFSGGDRVTLLRMINRALNGNVMAMWGYERWEL